jgi:hypothetical protein
MHRIKLLFLSLLLNFALLAPRSEALPVVCNHKIDLASLIVKYNPFRLCRNATLRRRTPRDNQGHQPGLVRSNHSPLVRFKVMQLCKSIDL